MGFDGISLLEMIFYYIAKNMFYDVPRIVSIAKASTYNI